MTKNERRGPTRLLVNALVLQRNANGARIFLENILQHLPDVWVDAEVHVLAPPGITVPGHERLKVTRLGLPRPGGLRIVEELLRLPSVIAALQPDVVLSPNESVPIRSRRPIVVVAQNLLYHCGVEPPQSGPLRYRLRSRAQFSYYRWQMPRAYRRADAVVAVSNHAARALAARAGLDLSRVDVVPCGADRLPIKRVTPSAGPLRLICVGAVAYYKRLDIAVRALGLLRRPEIEYELVLVGEEWPGQGQDIDRMAAETGVQDRVRRLGAVPDDRLVDLLGSSHAALALSACESFGIPVLEAMRAGLPVVVADEPWSVETAGEEAVRVVGNDANSVAAGIRTLEDPSEWRRRAEAGRQRAARFTWAATATGVADVARRVCDRS